jgi:hypothetical protein
MTANDKLVSKPAFQISRQSVGLILSAYTVCYFCFALNRALKHPLWLDEVSTLWMCRLPDLGHIWGVLALNAADTAPPAFYAITRLLLHLTGNDHIGIRLLSIVGFYSAQIGIFLFTRVRLGPAVGLFAMLLPIATAGLAYATDGRPYAAVLGCFAMAMWFWQSRAEDAKWGSSVGLWLSLAIAISLHFFAVLILVPIAAAELARAFTRKKVDWQCWAAIIASLVPLIIYFPLIIRMRPGALAATSAPGFYARPTLRALIDAYQQLFAPPGWGALIAVIAVVFLAARLVWPSSEEPGNGVGFNVSETVLAISLLLFPLFVYVFARLLTHTFHVRYSLPAIFGYCVVAAALLALLPQRAILALLLSAAQVAVMAVGSFRELRRMPGTPDIEVIQTVRDDLPIVVGQGLNFIELMQNAPPHLRDRLVYLPVPDGVPNADPTNDTIVKNWARIYPLPVYPASEFLAGHSMFILYQTGLTDEALTDWVLRSAQSVAILAHKGDQWVFLISPQAKP